MRRWIILLISSVLATSGLAELKLARLFSDGMVLQRDQPVPVWGWADPGADVTVRFGGREKQTRAGDDGAFRVRLKKMDASATPNVLKVEAGGDVVEVKNVLVGEVWLCSGQSNMEWPVEKSKDYEEEKAAADFPGIRMFLTDRAVSAEPVSDCAGSWEVCTPDNVGSFSAVAYFFGREIHRELGVPVGLIRSCWGGTRIEAWSPMDSLRPYPAVMEYKAANDREAATFDEAAEEVRYSEALDAWEEEVKQAEAEGKKPPRRPRRKIHPHKNKNYPANLYNAMIHPLVPYAIRGAIWYQGESNAHSIDEAAQYRELLENMVIEWRKDWGHPFPFYAVQLVNYKAPVDEPVQDTAWALIRESFLDFHREFENAGMAVGIDVGEADNIHPKNKQAIGYRLAQQALAKTYGKEVVPGGPIYKEMKKDGNKIVLRFDDIGSGLVEQGGEPLKWFAVAGADRKFHKAHAVIVDDMVIVSAEAVDEPVAVRYAWADNPVGCNLFNKEGFPASPFRTDDWPVADK